jgi:hypothetical protein
MSSAAGPPGSRRVLGALALGLLAGPAASGCGSSRAAHQASPLPAALVREARPIGRGARFHPRATGPIVGPCTRDLGPRVGVHVELFAANRVVIVPSGIGTKAPRAYSAGRIARARRYGDLVTLEPTGVVLVRPHVHRSLLELFRSWGQPLSIHRMASFSAPAGERVSVFVDGRRWRGSAARVPLSAHREIVLEIGPYVPPHSHYTFPPGA